MVQNDRPFWCMGLLKAIRTKPAVSSGHPDGGTTIGALKWPKANLATRSSVSRGRPLQLASSRTP